MFIDGEIPADRLRRGARPPAWPWSRRSPRSTRRSWPFTSNGDPSAISADKLRAALRRATIAGRAVPVLFGAAFRNKGVQPLLDAVVDFLPSPADLPAVVGVTATGEKVSFAPSESEPFSALAFKIMNDAYVGPLTFLRVYSGKVESGATVFNATKGKRERLGRLLQMHANKKEDLRGIGCGNIAAAVGLRVTTTGDTLCDPARSRRARDDRLSAAGDVGGDRAEDPGRADRAGRGAGEAGRRGSLLQGRRRRRRPGRPSSRAWASCTSRSSSTAWRASSRSPPTSAGRRWPTARPCTAAIEHEETFVHEIAGRGQFAQVRLRLEPAGAGEGVLFENALEAGSLPKEFVAAVERGRPRGPAPRSAGRLPR